MANAVAKVSLAALLLMGTAAVAFAAPDEASPKFPNLATKFAGMGAMGNRLHHTRALPHHGPHHDHGHAHDHGDDGNDEGDGPIDTDETGGAAHGATPDHTH